MSHFFHNQTFSVQDVRGVIFSVKRSKSNATSIKNRKYFKFGEVGLRSSQKKKATFKQFWGPEAWIELLKKSNAEAVACQKHGFEWDGRLPN